MEEILKMKKKERIMVILLIFLLLLVALIVFFVSVNKKEPEPVIIEKTALDYIELSDVDNVPYLTIYETVNLKKINFINIPEVLVSNFYNKQTEILTTLNNNISINKEYIENYNTTNNINNYVVDSNIDSIILYELNDDILSVLYLIEDTVDYIGLTNYITNIFIDVKNNSILNTDMLLNKYNLNKENIASEVFNSVVEGHSDKFVDKDTKEEKDKSDIQINKEEYMQVLVDDFDAYMYLYFYQENLYLKYNKIDIANKLFNEELSAEKYSTMKLKIN